MERDPAYLVDLDNAARHAVEFVHGMTFDQFRASELTQAAVLYEFTICGEAVRRLSAAFRDAHSEIPWTRIVAFRNRVTHDYANIDLEIVWRILQDEVPALRDQLAP